MRLTRVLALSTAGAPAGFFFAPDQVPRLVGWRVERILGSNPTWGANPSQARQRPYPPADFPGPPWRAGHREERRCVRSLDIMMLKR
jgi:hypothetical protein